jgi:hypothetical protein
MFNMPHIFTIFGFSMLGKGHKNITWSFISHITCEDKIVLPHRQPPILNIKKMIIFDKVNPSLNIKASLPFIGTQNLFSFKVWKLEDKPFLSF